MGHGDLKCIADQAKGDACQLASIVGALVCSRLFGNAVTRVAEAWLWPRARRGHVVAGVCDPGGVGLRFRPPPRLIRGGTKGSSWEKTNDGVKRE